MATFTYAVILASILGSIALVYRRPGTAEAVLAWIIKWRIRIFLVFWMLSILVALGSGSPALVLYGGLSLAVFVLWLFIRGPGKEVL